MSKFIKKISAIFMVTMMLTMMAAPVLAADQAEDAQVAVTETKENAVSVEETAATATDENSADGSASSKAIGASLCVGLVAAAGAVGMGMAISKAVEGIARQPEAEGKIRTSLMLGLVFIETAIIYALIIAILIIFVL